MSSLGRAMSQRFINVCDNQLFNPAVPTRPVHSVKGAMMMIRREIVRDLNDVLFYPHFHFYKGDLPRYWESRK